MQTQDNQVHVFTPAIRVVKTFRFRQICRCRIVEKSREQKCQRCRFRKSLKKSNFVNNCWGYFRLIFIQFLRKYMYI